MSTETAPTANGAADALDERLNEVYPGRVVRKDLLHQVKKGTNVPSFVLEFLLARFCASDDPDEIRAGIEATVETLQRQYVRPDESNRAQSLVQQRGRHTFIDKVHVRYVESEKRHWAAMENFNSRRIAVGPEFYRDNDRLLEGGIWAEVTLGYNDIEEDPYAFYVEDLRPIQLSRFDADRYLAGRAEFSRDEWLDVVLRSVGLEPAKLSHRLKLHYVARLAPLVEPNFNFIELGPRGTGKSYFYSEFSPYATLVSGGQATKAVLFYNNARGRVGLVGFWDTVAFDEVAGIRVRDPDAIQIMKDYMANGRFSRGVEVIADASLAFVGNIDHSIDELVRSPEHDLFEPLPEALDLAVMDRFYHYLPGWEMPKNSSAYLTDRYGFITDYLAEAFHHLAKHQNRYEYVSSRARLGPAVEGRDEKAVKKTVAAFLKILHPAGEPTDAEFEEYVAYAVEGRRRVKEQMNKRKPDDEFARINLSYFTAGGEEVVVYCPESRDAAATQRPARKRLRDAQAEGEPDGAAQTEGPSSSAPQEPAGSAGPNRPESEEHARVGTETNAGQDRSEHGEAEEDLVSDGLAEQHFTIFYDDTGYSYGSILGAYLRGAKRVEIDEPYLRAPHQVQNLVRFCEVVAAEPTVKEVALTTGYGHDAERDELEHRLSDLVESLKDVDITLSVVFNPRLHDREIRIDNGWTVKIGRGLDIYQRPHSRFELGAHDLDLRRCLETKVDIFKVRA